MHIDTLILIILIIVALILAMIIAPTIWPCINDNLNTFPIGGFNNNNN